MSDDLSVAVIEVGGGQVPPPFVPPAKVEVDEPLEKVFVEPSRDDTIEQLRNNIEEEIKRAGEPVDAVIKLLEKFDELDKEVRQGASRFTAWEEFKSEYSKVQRKLGEATGYRAALASSVLAFVMEKRRRPE